MCIYCGRYLLPCISIIVHVHFSDACSVPHRLLPASVEGSFDESALRAVVIAYNLFVFGCADDFVVMDGDMAVMNRDAFARSQTYPGVTRLLV